MRKEPQDNVLRPNRRRQTTEIPGDEIVGISSADAALHLAFNLGTDAA